MNQEMPSTKVERATKAAPHPVVLVTCNAYPDLNASERLYAAALTARGCKVAAARWNGPSGAFDTDAAIILRSNWDFHYDPGAFLEWMMGLRHKGRTIYNQPEVVAWNVDKHYLLDLASRGVRTPMTRIVPNDRDAITRVFDEANVDQAVIKPSVGASGYDVELVTREDLRRRQKRQLWTRRSPVIVQEYLPELRQTGEISCVFFDGVFSHALLRRPVTGEFRVNSRYGGETSLMSVSHAIVRQAQKALAVWNQPLLYARVDGAIRNQVFILTELELNEPDLDLHLAPGAADRFADATLKRLRHPDAYSVKHELVPSAVHGVTTTSSLSASTGRHGRNVMP
jgi:glutathione synthase/RimK-type ligase-like ATP-grasp enzyme